MKNNLLKRIALPAFLLLIFNIELPAQNVVVDSSLLDRITALEGQVNYKKPGESHLMVAGLATFGFVANKTTNTIGGVSTTTKSNTFGDPDTYEFSPMFLWRHGTKFLMEFEPSFADNSLGVNWADVSYFAAPNLIFRVGYLVLPFGTYSKRLAAGWIDKLATDPMGIADMAPTDFGFEMEGGLPLGNMKMSYDVALSNGSQLLSDGSLTSGNLTDNNKNKTLTARLGLLPFSNSCLELGVSGMFGKVGDEGSGYANAKGDMYAFDLNFVKTLTPLLVNIKGQYNIANITNEDYVDPQNSNQTYTFNNHTTAGFAQASIRPTSGSNFIKNLELAGRYTSYNLPANSTFGTNQHTVTVGLDYWLSWRTVFKFTYEAYKGNSTASQQLGAYTGLTNMNSFYIQFSTEL
jgi:hypothetical protein